MQVHAIVPIWALHRTTDPSAHQTKPWRGGSPNKRALRGALRGTLAHAELLDPYLRQQV